MQSFLFFKLKDILSSCKVPFLHLENVVSSCKVCYFFGTYIATQPVLSDLPCGTHFYPSSRMYVNYMQLTNKMNTHSFFYLNINQLDALNFYNELISSLYMFRAHVLIVRRSKLYYTASGIITRIGGRPVHRLRKDWIQWMNVRTEGCNSLRSGNSSILPALNFQPAATREPDGLCGNQHYRRELLIMGIMVPETC